MARYIDADALLLEDFTDAFVDIYDVKIFEYIIENAPSADVVEVRRGYWEIAKGSNGKEKMVCTNCRHQQDLHSTFTYCPNCGALINGRVIHNG